jgi:hypothetical protein
MAAVSRRLLKILQAYLICHELASCTIQGEGAVGPSIGRMKKRILDVSVGSPLRLQIGDKECTGEILSQRKHPLLRGSGEFEVRITGDFEPGTLIQVMDSPYDGYQGEVKVPICGEGTVAVRIAEKVIQPLTFAC